MARLLVGDQWFQWIPSSSWTETDFQNVVVSRADSLFPGWTCVPFTETVQGEDGARNKPDLALLDVHYRVWWVVEVELAHHSLERHVLPQVSTFANGRYGAAHASALIAKHAALDGARLVEMMRGLPPKVLVVADSPSVVPSWRPRLRSIDVALATVEPFRDVSNKLILRLNGDQPELPGEVLTRCSRHPMLRRFWLVHSPAGLPLQGGDALPIAYGGIVTRWRVVRLQDAVMLTANSRGDVLADLRVVDLITTNAGELSFVPVASVRRVI